MDQPSDALHRASLGRTDWRLVLLLIGAGVLCGFQIGKVPPAVPELRQDLGLDLVTAGWVIGMFSLIAAVVGIAAGAVADFAGHRRVVLFGLIFLAAPGFAVPFTPGVSTLLVGRFLEGLGYIGVMVSIPSIIIRSTNPQDLRLALGFWGAWFPIGVSLMMLASPLLLSQFGWRGLWLFNAAIVAAFAAIFAVASRRLDPAASRPIADRARGSLKRMSEHVIAVAAARGALVLAIGYGIFTANMIAVIGFLPTLLIDTMGSSRSAAALLGALAMAVTILGILGTSYLRHWGVPRWILMSAGNLVMGLSAFGIYATDLSPSERYGFCLAYTLFAGALPGTVFSATPVFAPIPAMVATVNGLVVQCANMGLLVGPPILAGFVSLYGGWHTAPWLIAGAAAIAIVLAAIEGGYERRLESAVRRVS